MQIAVCRRSPTDAMWVHPTAGAAWPRVGGRVVRVWSHPAQRRTIAGPTIGAPVCLTRPGMRGHGEGVRQLDAAFQSVDPAAYELPTVRAHPGRFRTLSVFHSK